MQRSGLALEAPLYAYAVQRISPSQSSLQRASPSAAMYIVLPCSSIAAAQFLPPSELSGV
eukprot:CAMPEP_0172842476 /NCGR_PEP_ID=MMETSP1075-20121228/30742_1 /TAXON_ID=2916 /ORGANISM="Ceratium fusus, Strain PA161109" /LENGTH=59 /DNA_ID=CAMNT_0013686607 /DNA_START=378 /DNA_END=557 /DNA_ORIENTATION=+